MRPFYVIEINCDVCAGRSGSCCETRSPCIPNKDADRNRQEPNACAQRSRGLEPTCRYHSVARAGRRGSPQTSVSSGGILRRLRVRIRQRLPRRIAHHARHDPMYAIFPAAESNSIPIREPDWTYQEDEMSALKRSVSIRGPIGVTHLFRTRAATRNRILVSRWHGWRICRLVSCLRSRYRLGRGSPARVGSIAWKSKRRTTTRICREIRWC